MVFDFPFSVVNGLKIGSVEEVISDEFDPFLVSASVLVDVPATDTSESGDIARDCSEAGETARATIDDGDIALEEIDWSSSIFLESLSIKSVDAGRLSLSFGSSIIGECVLYAKADIGFSGCERYSDDDCSFFFSFTFSPSLGLSFSFPSFVFCSSDCPGFDSSSASII